MAGPNTTGVPKTEDYNLGRGVLYFAELDSTTQRPIAYRDLGNSPDFKISIDLESLEHQSSRQGLKVVDKQVVISQKCSVTFSLDEVNHENLSAFFSGEKSTHTNVSVAGFAEHLMVADGDLEVGRWYDIVNSSGSRAYDIDATKLNVDTNETVQVTLVKDTDYTLDATMGRIFIKSTSTKAATAISAGKGLQVTLTADATAAAVNEVRTLNSTGIIGALKFIGANPADEDKQTEYQFHKVTLKASGEFALIGDDWTQMTFSAAAESNTLASSTSPTLTIRNVA